MRELGGGGWSTVLIKWGAFIYFLTVLIFNVVYSLSSNYLLDTCYTLQEL